jgi:hypothetical protein
MIYYNLEKLVFPDNFWVNKPYDDEGENIWTSIWHFKLNRNPIYVHDSIVKIYDWQN